MKLAWIALFVAACGSSDAPAPKPEAPAARSGKIDLPGAAPAPGMRDGKIPHRDRTARMDTDGDGAVSDQERQENVDRRSAAMKARADLDGDGTVSEEEMAKGRRQRAEGMHSRLDKNGDGKVTVDELGDTRVRRFDPTAADANKDGTLTVEELEAAMKTAGPGPWGRRRGRWGEGRGSGAVGSGSGT